MLNCYLLPDFETGLFEPSATKANFGYNCVFVGACLIFWLHLQGSVILILHNYGFKSYASPARYASHPINPKKK